MRTVDPDNCNKSSVSQQQATGVPEILACRLTENCLVCCYLVLRMPVAVLQMRMVEPESLDRRMRCPRIGL